ncbi:MAG: protoheme IX farnesyltransferase [Rhodospirillales bacterium]|nr:protoheme IX farnesyltransferase [Rhodospirillales bacterium]MBI2977447.1 protoheme IX farnesyltransferase [Rhodospirillales bacterium]
MTSEATATSEKLSDPSRSTTDAPASAPRFRVADYALLLKPRVMSLVVFTGVVGLAMAPGKHDPMTMIAAVVCIALGAGAAGAINMWYDRDIDQIMRRTMNRPLPAGRLGAGEALAFGVALAVASVAAMTWLVNVVAAVLLATTILYYVFIYTVWLKRRTPQNIVIGGVSGALPPVIGWAAVTGDVGLGALVLFAIIFLWTPPHSWALALFRRGDYEAAGVPMMPVIAGERGTKRLMLVYTALLIPASLLPVAIGMSGALYGAAAVALGIGFAGHAWRVWKDDDASRARPMFFFSIFYLFLIYVALLADRLLFYPVF